MGDGIGGGGGERRGGIGGTTVHVLMCLVPCVLFIV